jgi:hypothetical protein
VGVTVRGVWPVCVYASHQLSGLREREVEADAVAQGAAFAIKQRGSDLQISSDRVVRCTSTVTSHYEGHYYVFVELWVVRGGTRQSSLSSLEHMQQQDVHWQAA